LFVEKIEKEEEVWNREGSLRVENGVMMMVMMMMHSVLNLEAER